MKGLHKGMGQRANATVCH